MPPLYWLVMIVCAGPSTCLAWDHFMAPVTVEECVTARNLRLAELSLASVRAAGVCVTEAMRGRLLSDLDAFGVSWRESA